LKGFFKTVAIVTVFSIAEKFLGFLYRIYLSRTIGSEGIGLYQVALSVFALLLTITCSGTPITVSRLMTKYRAEGNEIKVKKVVTAGLSFTFAVALPICLIFLIFGKNFTFLFADARCMQIFLIVMPGLVFTSVYAVLRGVFWGNKDFLPYSVTELLEEICMIVVGIFLIGNTTDVERGATSAGVAVLISYIFSFSLATIVFLLRKNKLKNPVSEFKPLLASALPVTAMRTANSFAVSLVSIILPVRLIDAGYSSAGAMSAFGAAVGQAIPLLFVPTTLIGSFILVLVPEISENFYKGNHFFLKRDVEKAIKFTTLLSAVFVPIFFVCGEEIGIIVFDGYECGKYLTASSFLVLFMSLSSVTTSILNSIGLEHKTLVYYIISGIFMLLSIYFLPKYVGIYSLLIGFSFIYGLTTLLNLRLINKNCPQKPRYKKFLLYSVLILIPTTFLGKMTEILLLPLLGTILTFFACSIAMVIFHLLLYVGFNLVDFKLFKKKFIEKPTFIPNKKTA
jgi:stage V sporulation protein B